MVNKFIEYLKLITIKRMIAITLHKLLYGLFLYFIVIKITQFDSINYIFDLNFVFSIADFIKLGLLSIILDTCKVAVFEKYDFPYSNISHIGKLIFEPNIQTFFVFLNSGIIYLMITLLDYTDKVKESSVILIIAYS
jgi:hypothetical protein